MPSENVALAREAYDAFNRRDLPAALEKLDPEIEWRMHEQFTRVPRVYKGHDGVREVFELFFENFDDFRIDPEEFIEVDEQLVVCARLHGKQKGSGAPIEFYLVHVWQTRDHLATALNVYSTKEEALDSVSG